MATMNETGAPRRAGYFRRAPIPTFLMAVAVVCWLLGLVPVWVSHELERSFGASLHKGGLGSDLLMMSYGLAWLIFGTGALIFVAALFMRRTRLFNLQDLADRGLPPGRFLLTLPELKPLNTRQRRHVWREAIRLMTWEDPWFIPALALLFAGAMFAVMWGATSIFSRKTLELGAAGTVAATLGVAAVPLALMSLSFAHLLATHTRPYVRRVMEEQREAAIEKPAA